MFKEKIAKFLLVLQVVLFVLTVLTSSCAFGYALWGVPLFLIALLTIVAVCMQHMGKTWQFIALAVCLAWPVGFAFSPAC